MSSPPNLVTGRGQTSRVVLRIAHRANVHDACISCTHHPRQAFDLLYNAHPVILLYPENGCEHARNGVGETPLPEMPRHQASWTRHGDLFQPQAQAASGLGSRG